MHARGWLLVSQLALALLAGGCNAGDDPVDEDAVVACDPLSAQPAQAIELGSVLAAGRAANGQVFVLAENDEGELRAFVSEQDALQRKRVLGEGSSNEAEKTSRQASVEGNPSFTLYVETTADGAVTFVRIEGEERVVSVDDIEAGEVLELLDEDELEDFEVENLSPVVAIEYLGTLTDDRRVLVVRPEEDWDYEDFRVFLGAPDRMLERAVGEVVRLRDGGSTTIELTVDGEPSTLDFPVLSTDAGGFEPGPATLEQGSERFAIELEAAPAPSDLDDLEFFCRAGAGTAIGSGTGEGAYRPIN